LVAPQTALGTVPLTVSGYNAADVTNG